MNKEWFTTFEITKILGLKIDRQKDWLTRGFIEPSIQKATGQGSKNIFSLEDLYLIALFQHLVHKGFSRKAAAARIKSIRYMLAIAKGVDRIRETKLNAAGLAQIRRQWSKLDDIDFIVLGWAPEAKKSSRDELPPTEALRFDDSKNKDCIEITREKYAGVEDIILVNFKKIRTQVDLGIENL